MADEVPVTIYTQDGRKVIGKAKVIGNEINCEIIEEYSYFLQSPLAEFSIRSAFSTKQGGAEINLKKCRFCGCSLTYNATYTAWAENEPPNCPNNPSGPEHGHILRILRDDIWT